MTNYRCSYLGKEDYQKIERGVINRFGKESNAYKTIFRNVDPELGLGNNFFFSCVIAPHLPEGYERYARFDELSSLAKQSPEFFDVRQIDTPELVLRGPEYWSEETVSTFKKLGYNIEKSCPILDNLVSQVRKRGLYFSPENPLVLSELELVVDENKDNSLGINLEIGTKTIVKNDSRFSSKNKTIMFGNQEVELWTQKLGLSRIYISEVGVCSNDNELYDPTYNGKGIVVSRPL